MEFKLDYLFCILVICLFSTVLHEIAHGAVAYWQGDQTAKLSGRLSLNPLKHIDPFMSIMMPLILGLMGLPVFGGAKPVPINTRNLKHGEWSFALVAIAGPLTNFVLALVFFLIGYYSGALMNSGFAGTFFSAAVSINVGFLVFNIVPIPPLDGSRVLYALAPDFVKDLMETIEKYGVFVIYVLILVCGGLFSNYMSTASGAIIDLFCWIVGAN